MPYAAAIALRYRYCRLFESHELSGPDKRPDTGSDIGICSRRSGSDDVESTHTASQTQHSVLTQFDATLRTLSSEHSVRRNTENTQFSVLRLTRSVSGLYIIALHANIGGREVWQVTPLMLKSVSQVSHTHATARTHIGSLVQ